MVRRILVLASAFLGIGMLILDGRTAIQSAGSGVEQCMYTVVPALFPFFLFSSLLVNALSGVSIPLLSGLLGIPNGSESLFLAGCLGGYPVGAHCISQANLKNGLPDAAARRMMGFCVNAGPSFLFGICGALFSRPYIAWVLWLIHVTAAFLTGMLLPGKDSGQQVKLHAGSIAISAALRTAVTNMALVCGWIVLYRVLIGFADRWLLWLIPQDLRCLLIGFCELTNGCLELTDISSHALRFVLCSAFLSLGGSCVWMQVQAVSGNVGLGMFLPGKLLQCLISTVLAMLVQHLLFETGISLTEAAAPALLLAILLVALLPISSIYKKSGSFSTRNHV